MQFTTVQHLTRKEYIRLGFALAYRKWWVILINLYLVVLIVLWFIRSPGYREDLVWLMVPLGFLFVFAGRVLWTARRAYKKYPVLSHPITYSFHEDGYDISAHQTNASVQWSQVMYMITAGGFIVLEARKGGNAILKVATLTDEQEIFIADKFARRPLPHLAVNHPGALRKSTPPYEWGWIGLVPLVGALAGAILLFKAVFQYKDKKLGIIAIAAMIPTALLYSLPFIFLKICRLWLQDFGCTLPCN